MGKLTRTTVISLNRSQQNGATNGGFWWSPLGDILLNVQMRESFVEGRHMLARRSHSSSENSLDEKNNVGSLACEQASLADVSVEPSLVSFQSPRGFQVHVVEFRECLFEGLLRMYEDFEPKRGAQGLPPVGRDRLILWLRKICDDNLNLIALLGDQVIGHAMLCPIKKSAAEFAIFIHQNFRNQGIGSRFTEITLQYGKFKGLEHVWLTVEVNNFSAVRVYKKMGFRITGTYYPEIEMELDLKGRPP